MQLRWHDPQPMAMVQHGGRIKLREAASIIEAGKAAPAQTMIPEHDCGEPGKTEDGAGRPI